MGTRTVQGESRNRADCEDHRECFPQSRGRAEVRYRPKGPRERKVAEMLESLGVRAQDRE